MTKRKSDEPDDKALERLRQFEESRKPVPDKILGDEKKKKNGKKDSGKKNEKDHPDRATDDLRW
jgi:hypothetical protein